MKQPITLGKLPSESPRNLPETTVHVAGWGSMDGELKLGAVILIAKKFEKKILLQKAMFTTFQETYTEIIPM